MLEIPGYQILREIGRGGMATVYLGVQQSPWRDVAIKPARSTVVPTGIRPDHPAPVRPDVARSAPPGRSRADGGDTGLALRAQSCVAPMLAEARTRSDAQIAAARAAGLLD